MVKQHSITKFLAWFFAIISLLAIGTGIYYYLTLNQQLAKQRATVVRDDNIYRMQLDNLSNENLNLTIESLDNISSEIHKLAITSNCSMQHKVACQLVVDANTLVTCFERLPIVNGELHGEMENLANRLYGYAITLTDSCSKGEVIKEGDITSLLAMRPTINNLSQKLAEVASSDDGKAYTNSLRTDHSNAIDKAINNFEMVSDTFDYVGMYGKEEQSKLTLGKKLNDDELTQVVSKHLADKHEIKQAKLTKAGSDDNFTHFQLNDNQTHGEVVVTIDGRIAEVALTGSDNENTISEKQMQQLAEQYCADLGYDVKHLSHVQQWGSRSYVMLAPRIHGAVIASDLITVAIEGDKVVAINCGKYLNNHYDRQLKWGNLTSEDAEKTLNHGVVVARDRVVVDVDGKQHCCHMYVVSLEEKMYNIYVDSMTGEHVRIDALTHGN